MGQAAVPTGVNIWTVIRTYLAHPSTRRPLGSRSNCRSQRTMESLWNRTKILSDPATSRTDVRLHVSWSICHQTGIPSGDTPFRAANVQVRRATSSSSGNRRSNMQMEIKK